MELGELPAEKAAVGPEASLRSERVGGACGGLVEEHGALLRLEGGRRSQHSLLVHGEEALKAEAACGEAGDRQGVDGGSAAAGDGDDGDALQSAEAHETLPGVGDGGGAGVRHQGAALPGEEALEDGLAGGGLVVLGGS